MFLHCGKIYYSEQIEHVDIFTWKNLNAKNIYAVSFFPLKISQF